MQGSASGSNGLRRVWAAIAWMVCGTALWALSGPDKLAWPQFRGWSIAWTPPAGASCGSARLIVCWHSRSCLTRLATRDDPRKTETSNMAPRGRAPWWPRICGNPVSSCQSRLHGDGPHGGRCRSPHAQHIEFPRPASEVRSLPECVPRESVAGFFAIESGPDHACKLR